MTEEAKLESLFSGRLWLNKYAIDWCELCNTAVIICPDCKNTSCNGSGCEKCNHDFSQFHFKNLTRVEHYLNGREEKIYRKCLSIKKHMLESLRDGNSQIDFQKMKTEGKFSKNELDLFNLNGT